MSSIGVLPSGSPRAGGEAPRVTTLERLRRYLRSRLLWHHAYRALSYVRSALWVVPLVAIALVFATAPLLRLLDGWLDWSLADMHVEGARALYQTIITLTLSFIVFTFGFFLVALQIAGGQLTPRIIATTLLRDNVVRYSVGLFFYALVFSIIALDRLQDVVHAVVSVAVATLGVACMAVFLFLIDYAARLLRPVSVVSRVGDEGLRVIHAVYPQLSGEDDRARGKLSPTLGPPQRIVRHEGRSEIVLAVDLENLVAEAAASRGVVELVPQVGDFLAQGEALFALHGGAERIDDRKLRASVAMGVERTLEQDPIFAFRILVDIALKALSPAINDPTTAVARPRSGPPAAALGRSAAAARRGGRRRARRAARDLPHSELGGLRPRLLSGDPELRRRQRPDRAPVARDAREPDRGAAGSPAGVPRAPAHASRPDDRDALPPGRGPGARTDPGRAGARWRVAHGARPPLSRPASG